MLNLELKKEDLLIYLIHLMFVIEAMNRNKQKHYSISHKESYSIIDVAKMFNSKLDYCLQERVRDMPLL